MHTQEPLERCLVEGDPEEGARRRLRQRRSLLASIGLQAVALSASMVFATLAGVKPPRWYVLTPSPPYRGSSKAKPHVQATHPPSVQGIDRRLYLASPQNPKGAYTTTDETSSSVGSPDIPGMPLGDPNGILPPGLGSDHTRSIPELERQPQMPKPPPIIRRSEGVQQALLIHRVLPVYPSPALHSRIQGTVVLRAIIGRDGAVRSLQAASGHPLLLQAALEAVSQWRYRPTLLNGEPTEVETSITVISKLD